MASQTTNYGLVKPAYDEDADIAILNANADIIDSKLKEIADAAAGGGGSGEGDMLKSVYDTDNDGKVDSAENADTVGGFIVGKSVPADAAFTDTVYVHPGSGTNPHGTTKGDVGLENVDNIKQMPISGGVLENYREKLVTLANGVINLSNGNVFSHAPSSSTTYSISNAGVGAHSFTLIITQPTTAITLTFPASVKWQGGTIPDMTVGGKTYVLTFLSVDSGVTWLGMFGGEF